MISGGTARLQLEDCHHGCSWNTKRKPSQLEGITGGAAGIPEGSSANWKELLGKPLSWKDFKRSQSTTISWKADTWDAGRNFSQLEGLHLGLQRNSRQMEGSTRTKEVTSIN